MPYKLRTYLPPVLQVVLDTCETGFYLLISFEGPYKTEKQLAESKGFKACPNNVADYTFD